MTVTDRKLAGRRHQRLRRAVSAFCAIGIAVSLVSGSSALAGTTKPRPVPVDRDHRGKDDGVKYVRGGLKPPGARRDPGWGNYGNGKGSGPTVRDHRQ